MTISFNIASVRKFITFSSLIIFWEIASRIGWINPFYMPAPTEVVKVIIELFEGGEIWKHLSATFFAAIVSRPSARTRRRWSSPVPGAGGGSSRW